MLCPPEINILSVLAKFSWKMKLNFPHSVLFHMKTRACCRIFKHTCIYGQWNIIMFDWFIDFEGSFPNFKMAEKTDKVHHSSVCQNTQTTWSTFQRALPKNVSILSLTYQKTRWSAFKKIYKLHYCFLIK